MTGLSLQIDGKWAVLSDDVSVSIEGNSPVWGEGNSFSLPFELDIEANRHILGNADQITGQSVYEVLDGKRAVLYTLGIPVYYGKIKMDDEVELSEGTVDITLVSGNLTFDEMIDGMNCQDVELTESFEIGRELRSLVFLFRTEDSPLAFYAEHEMPNKQFAIHTGYVNESDPYPKKKYCNVGVCTQKGESREYLVFEANRAGTGVCFYLLYFLDCLFNKLELNVVRNDLQKVEDMTRLAFFSTSCEYRTEEVPLQNEIYTPYSFGLNKVFAKRMGKRSGTGYPYWGETEEVQTRTNRMFATSKNFPNVEVSEVIEGIKTAFGVILLHGEMDADVRLVLAKNILNDTEVKSIHAEIFEVSKLENNVVGFELGYSGGDDDNTSFNYSDYSNVNLDRDYITMRKNVSPYDKTLYIDKKTGDGFRIKIDEEALTDSTKELNPSLFEVGEFVSAKHGDCSDEERVEKVEIPFNPIIANDISTIEGVSNYKIFLDVDMGEYGKQTITSKSTGSYGSETHTAGKDQEKFTVDYTELTVTLEYDGYNYSQGGDNSGGTPINGYDAGFTLGILRPGEGSGVVDYEQNYDGEENWKYYFAAENTAFISDTIDHYGYTYDYNGNLPGGVDPSGRFSLKPRAEKPNPEGGFFPITESYAQRRGLFDKFYSEYAYFVVNRKIVKMKCRMEMADLLNIDWTKRYKIGEYVGFINKYSYSVSSTGMSDVELEMYYL